MRTLLLMALAAAPLFAEVISYEESKRDVNTYISQSADEQLFLEPVLRLELTDLADQITLDAGISCGVFGVDQSGVAKGSVACFQGDVSSLPFETESLARILSLNIGAQLPSSVYMNTDSRGLRDHCGELARVMTEDGRMLIVAPASFDQVFSDGSIDDYELFAKIERVLEKIGSTEDADRIMNALDELTEVNRATFVKRNNRLILVTDIGQLKLGEQVWRKEPDGVKLSYFHNEEEYLIAINQAGLFCEEIRRPCFFGKVKQRIYNAGLTDGQKGLGDSYVNHHPFTIYTVVKPV